MNALRMVVVAAAVLGPAVASADPQAPSAGPPPSPPTSEVYVESMGGISLTGDGNLVRVSIGARIGPACGGLDGFNLRIGASAHLAASQLGFSGVGGEAEVDTVAMHATRLGLRVGAELGTPAGGADHGLFVSVGGVVRFHWLSVRLDGYRARPGDNNGDTTPRYGAMLGVGVGGNPDWYHWLGIGVAAVVGGLIAGAMASG